MQGWARVVHEWADVFAQGIFLSLIEIEIEIEQARYVHEPPSGIHQTPHARASQPVQFHPTG
eukprot:355265-Chlamydomonas_euryale.AAC.2